MLVSVRGCSHRVMRIGIMLGFSGTMWAVLIICILLDVIAGALFSQ